MQADLGKRIELLIQAFDTSDDRIKLRILQEIARSTNINHLKTILPLSKYSNRLTAIAAASTVRQILAGLRIGKLSIGSLPPETIKETIDRLDSSYESWREEDLDSSAIFRDIVLPPAGMQGHELIDLCYGQAGMILALPVTDSSGAVVVDEGTELTNSHLMKIKSAGAKQIAVRQQTPQASGDNPGSGTAPGDENDPLAAQLNSRFAGHEQNENMMKIKSVTYEFLSSKGALK